MNIDFTPSPLGIQAPIATYLYWFIQNNDIKTIVETGICNATSSKLFLSALPPDGKLISCECCIQPKVRGLAQKDSRWTILEGKSQDVLEKFLMENCPPLEVDLFWHDSDHRYDTMKFEYELAYKYNIRFIGSHDIHHPGAWKDKDRALPNVWDEFITTRPDTIVELERHHNWGLAHNISVD